MSGVKATYPPGTAATATVRGVDGVRVVRVNSQFSPTQWLTPNETPSGFRWHSHTDVTDVRPLVLLDLEGYSGERAVNYLRNLAQESRDVMGNAPSPRGKLALKIADQIKAQCDPPRIDEPTEPLTEVMASTQGRERRRFVRGYDGIGMARWVDGVASWGWRDLIDPTLIREGVES